MASVAQRFFHLTSLLAALGCMQGVAAAEGATTPTGFHQEFETATALQDWVKQGDVAIDPALGFKSAASLRLTRTLAHIDDATSAMTPKVPAGPGTWTVSGSMATELHAPDLSYNAAVEVEWLDDAGNVLSRTEITTLGGTHAWQPFKKQVEAHSAATAARLRLVFNKTHGSCHVDDLALTFVAAAVEKIAIVDRITYTSASYCGMLTPDDKREITATVQAFAPLTAEQRQLTWQVRDYWGAEVGPATTLTLTDAGKNNRDRFAYTALMDVSTVALEQDRYYEVHTSVALPGYETASDFTTIAILPIAASKQYNPSLIPFTSRNWDHRMDAHPILSDRVGLRVCGIWGGFSFEEPTKQNMPQFDNAEKLGMHMLTGMPSHAITSHGKGYEKWTPELMRIGTRAMLEAYGPRGLRMISLGNEPPASEERAREALPFFKAIYEEAKAYDPTIQVIGTSVGATENYFKAGFQDYLDVYDFHAYEDPVAVRNTFAAYDELFAKYDCAKPIVSTELGLNSQGLSRLAITNDLVRKLSMFFALGGLHVSWFDLFYPDTNGTITGSNGDSFNAFNCKFNCYSPRIDAVAYYHMINGILVKKCLGEKLYDNGVLATMFRDDDGACFLVIYADKARKDIFLPLPGTHAVKVLRIDGSSAMLDAGGTGLTLGIGSDPLLLSWQDGASVLPTTLEAPTASLAQIPTGVVKGGSVPLTLALHGIAAADVVLALPDGWSAGAPTVGKDKDQTLATWMVTAPTITAAREGRVSFNLGDAGEIAFGIPVTGQVSLTVFATAQTAPGAAGLRLVVHNNGTKDQTVAASVTLVGEHQMARGNFEPAKCTPTTAFFAEVPEAKIAVPAGGDAEFTLPLEGLDAQTLYRVRAVVTDADGIALTRERLVSGFAQVPKVVQAPVLDGVLNETAWSGARELRIDEARQFFGFDKRTWRDATDLSSGLRLLWDADNLYLGVTVTDDVFRNAMADGKIWAGDGLQFLFDPCRESPDKKGKYDYTIAIGTKGPQAWCTYSADPQAPSGEATTIQIVGKKADDGSGGMTYEIAIPWARLAPFTPAAGRNLGMAMILNDDDGEGRNCFMGWFSGVHSKEVDVIGDLILGE